VREVLIVLLIAAAGYLAYDDFYKQRPALQKAQAEIQQLSQNPASVTVEPRYRVYAPANPTWSACLVSETGGTRLELGHLPPA
jgi:hypothetical protein